LHPLPTCGHGLDTRLDNMVRETAMKTATKTRRRTRRATPVGRLPDRRDSDGRGVPWYGWPRGTVPTHFQIVNGRKTIVAAHQGYATPPCCLVCGKVMEPVKVRRGWMATCFDCGGSRVFIATAPRWNCDHLARVVKHAEDGSWTNTYCRICHYSQFRYRYKGGSG